MESQVAITDIPNGKYYTLPRNSWILYYPLGFPETQIDAVEYQRFWNTHPVEHGTVKIFGRTQTVPRWQTAYGRDYAFSGQNHVARPIEDPLLVRLLGWTNSLAKNTWNIDLPYNGMVVNWYQTGDHYIGAHSDDEKQLVPNSPIFSFSYGTLRQFKITARKGSVPSFDSFSIPLGHNSVVIMGGEMQKHYKHEVPKSKTQESRINITLRMFK